MTLNAYIISLNPETEARNAALAFLLQRNGIAPRFITGVRGSALDAGTYFSSLQSYFWLRQRLMTPSELGVALSHAKAHATFLATGDPVALFLEDDVLLDDAGCAAIKRLAQTRYCEDGIIHLGGLDGLKPLYTAMRGWRVHEKPDLFKVCDHDVRLLTRLVGYLISPATAKKITEAVARNPFVIDDFRYWRQELGLTEFHFAKIVGHPVCLANSALEPERALLWSSPAYANNIWGVRAALERSFKLRVEKLFDKCKNLISRRGTIAVFSSTPQGRAQHAKIGDGSPRSDTA